MMNCVICKVARAYYGVGKVSTHCGKCSKNINEMRNLHFKMCVICKKTKPSFGTTNRKPTHCAKCSKGIEGMYDVISKKCIVCSSKQANFGCEGKKPTHCASCAQGIENLCNVRRKKCVICQKKTPSYGTSLKTATHCAGCASSEMLSVVGKKCIVCQQTSPTYGLVRGGSSTHCAQCAKGIDGLKDIKSKQCIVCKDKGPSYGIKPKCPTHCAKCAKGLAGFTNVVSKRCVVCNEKHPSYGIPGGRPSHCGACSKGLGLSDIVSKVCRTCPTYINNKTYDGYCYRCFIQAFPDNTLVRNHKTKERTVADFIRNSYPNFDLAFDKSITDGCSRRRPDVYLDMGDHIIIIEVDENQHSAYDVSCENKRTMTLFLDAGSRPLTFIRFNPDGYYAHDKTHITSCWEYTKGKGLCVIKERKRRNGVIGLNL
jgi:hypothetical protein